MERKHYLNRIFKSTAVKKVTEDGTMLYTHFGIDREHSYVYGLKSEDVLDVELTVLEQDVCIREYYKTHDENTLDYFAYYDISEDRIRFVYCNVKVYNCCFPYGADNACIKKGKQVGSNLIVEVKEML